MHAVFPQSFGGSIVTVYILQDIFNGQIYGIFKNAVIAKIWLEEKYGHENVHVEKGDLHVRTQDGKLLEISVTGYQMTELS
jgi:hypothetical protein